MPTFVIAAGGTAGHVVPALAVADALRAEGATVVFVGGERAERTLVPAAGYELLPVAVEGLSRTNPLQGAAAGAPVAPVVAAPGLARVGDEVDAVLGAAARLAAMARAAAGLARPDAAQRIAAELLTAAGA